MLLTILIVLAVIFLLGGGASYRTNKTYGYGGIGIGTVLLIVLLVMMLTGRI